MAEDNNDNDLGLDPEDVAKDVAARKLVGDLASESGYCLEGPVAAGADDPEGVCRVLIRVQTVWLQPKLDRFPFFFKKSGFFLDFAQPDVPPKHALFDLMEEIPMIGIPIRK